jgi:hypothetical protein
MINNLQVEDKVNKLSNSNNNVNNSNKKKEELKNSSPVINARYQWL